MFESMKDVFELIKGFVDFCSESVSYFSGMFPGFVSKSVLSFFILVGIICVIKLVKGLMSLVSGIAAGFL